MLRSNTLIEKIRQILEINEKAIKRCREILEINRKASDITFYKI